MRLIRLQFIVTQSVGSDWIKKPDGNEGSFVVGILEGNTWRKLADLDSGFRYWHTCELINDEKLVIMGGKNNNGKRVDILDLKSNTWSKVVYRHFDFKKKYPFIAGP